jgi:transcriptional regulator with XRE-family HTH domain
MISSDMADVTKETADEKKTLGEKLWRYRIEAGLSQEQLAKRAGVSQGAIAMIERGLRTRPYPSTLKKLADALEIRIKDLLPSVALFCATGLHAHARRALTAAVIYVGALGPLS